MSSWLNFTVRAIHDSFRVHHSRNARKYYTLLQTLPYGDFSSFDNNSMRVGPKSSFEFVPSDWQSDRPTWD